MKENEKRLLCGTLVGAWQHVYIQKPNYQIVVQAHYDLICDTLAFRYCKDGRNIEEHEVNGLGINDQIPYIKKNLQDFCAGIITKEASDSYREVMELEKDRKLLRNGE